MVQTWTIIDKDNNEVLYPSFLTDNNQHPRDVGWDEKDNHEFILVPFAPDPALHEWVDGQWQAKLSILRERKWNEIKNIRDEIRYGGFSTSKGKVDTDLDSQNRLSNAVTNIQSKPDEFTIDWTMFDNSTRTFTKSELAQLWTEVFDFDLECHTRGQELRRRIKEASLEELDLITWEEEPTL
jgi:hypothetical protein